MDESSLRELTRLLQRPDAVMPADGLSVHVRTVRVVRGGEEIEIRYAVPPLPDGVARQPAPTDGPLPAYAAEVAEELQGWATEHVRRFRPLPPFDRDQVAADLPPIEELWQLLLGQLEDAREVPGGLVGRYEGTEVTVLLTPEQWRDFVVDCEIACRSDYGVDADRPGGGPTVAVDELDETLATMDPDESFVVLDGHQLAGSTRAELPPVPGTAGAREAEEMRRRGGGGWFAYDADGTRHPFPE